jgi:hypothetical protein
MDLFTPIAEKAKLHPNFVLTRAPTAAGVRSVLNEWAEGFQDRDGKFVYEFQTTYNSCFWELYLFAVLKSLEIEIDFSHGAPDFVCANQPIALEATIASHASDDVPEWEKTIEGITHDDLGAAYTQSIIRLSNAFRGKATAYQDKYSFLPHMADRSYVIAISNFGTQDFNMLGDVAMQRLLYDVWKEREVYKENGSPVPVGLFRSDSFSHVSAVVYSTVATFGKARALSSGEGPFQFHAIRIRDNFEPIQIVAMKSDYEESLTDGLRLFTNPFAVVPLDADIFDDWGIRRFVADQSGGFVVSGHSEGDLCMRTVRHIISR